MPAKLPENYVKQPLPPYTLGTMPVGSEYDAADLRAMLVDLEGYCYLDPDVRITEAGFMHVRRDEAGTTSSFVSPDCHGRRRPYRRNRKPS